MEGWGYPSPIEAYDKAPAAKAVLYNMVRYMVSSQVFPEDICQAVHIMIYKGSKSRDHPGSYRPIALLDHAFKLLCSIFST